METMWFRWFITDQILKRNDIAEGLTGSPCNCNQQSRRIYLLVHCCVRQQCTSRDSNHRYCFCFWVTVVVNVFLFKDFAQRYLGQICVPYYLRNVKAQIQKHYRFVTFCLCEASRQQFLLLLLCDHENKCH